MESFKLKTQSVNGVTVTSDLPETPILKLNRDAPNPSHEEVMTLGCAERIQNQISSNETIEVRTENLDIHPVAERTYHKKDLTKLLIALDALGLLEPLDVVKFGDKYLVIDGVSRLYAARHKGWASIKVRILDLTDEEAEIVRVMKNVKTKRPLGEQLKMVIGLLEALGNSQGKKRNLEVLGGIYPQIEETGGNLDSYELAVVILELEMSASTLRKLMKIYQFENSGNDEAKGLKLLERIDSGELSTDRAYKLSQNYQERVVERETPSLLDVVDLCLKWPNYVLHNKSCKDLSELGDQSVNTAVTSQGYYNQRIYPPGVNPGEIKLGEEPTVEQFIENSVQYYRSLKRVLTEDGNLFINIAESYSDGICLGVVSRLTMAMLDDGWHLVQPITWRKTNPKPQGPNIKRLRPSTEVILHFVLNPSKRFYRKFKIWDRDAWITIQGGCNDEFQGNKKQKKKKIVLKDPTLVLTDFLDEQVIDGIVNHSVVNKSHLKKIDPDFNHLAPAPELIMSIPILTTTRPGDVVLDIFTGTSSFLVMALRLKRNVIGYDTDPESIAFSKKRLQGVLKELFTDAQIHTIESTYLDAA
jgi:DNA modification methylase